MTAVGPITTAMVSDIVTRRPGTSYPELQHAFDDGEHNPYGDTEVGPRSDLVFWQGLSHDLFEAINAALVAGTIHAHVLGSDLEVLVVYGDGGGFLDLPVARRPPMDRLYTRPHWVPVVWYPGSGCEASSCLGPTADARSTSVTAHARSPRGHDGQ